MPFQRSNPVRLPTHAAHSRGVPAGLGFRGLGFRGLGFRVEWIYLHLSLESTGGSFGYPRLSGLGFRASTLASGTQGVKKCTKNAVLGLYGGVPRTRGYFFEGPPYVGYTRIPSKVTALNPKPMKHNVTSESLHLKPYTVDV